MPLRAKSTYCSMKALPTRLLSEPTSGKRRNLPRQLTSEPSNFRIADDTPERCHGRVFHTWRSSVGSQGRGHLHRDNEVAGEKIGEQVSERRRTTELSGRNPSGRFTPFPTG